MSSFLIHRYDDGEDLNPFLDKESHDIEEKIHPLKGKNPVVIKLKLLDWRHRKQLLVNVFVVFCLVCIGIIPLVYWPRHNGPVVLVDPSSEFKKSNLNQHEHLNFRQFQDVNERMRYQNGHTEDDITARKLHIESQKKIRSIHSNTNSKTTTDSTNKDDMASPAISDNDQSKENDEALKIAALTDSPTESHIQSTRERLT